MVKGLDFHRKVANFPCNSLPSGQDDLGTRGQRSETEVKVEVNDQRPPKKPIFDRAFS